MRKAARSNSPTKGKATPPTRQEGAHHPLHSKEQRVPAPLPHPLVGVIMGSKSDWETMAHTAETLEKLDIPFEVRVVSAHRTPDQLFEYAGSAEQRGLEVIIAAAGGAAHLPWVTAAKTALPVLGGPMESQALKGLEALLSARAVVAPVHSRHPLERRDRFGGKGRYLSNRLDGLTQERARAEI